LRFVDARDRSDRAKSYRRQGADEAQIGALSLSTRCCTAEILDDALFHFLETVMIFVEHFLGDREVGADLALLAPRQRHDRIDVVAHDGRFRLTWAT
jgi:hypothetical protein